MTLEKNILLVAVLICVLGGTAYMANVLHQNVCQIGRRAALQWTLCGYAPYVTDPVLLKRLNAPEAR